MLFSSRDGWNIAALALTPIRSFILLVSWIFRITDWLYSSTLWTTIRKPSPTQPGEIVLKEWQSLSFRRRIIASITMFPGLLSAYDLSYLSESIKCRSCSNQILNPVFHIYVLSSSTQITEWSYVTSYSCADLKTKSSSLLIGQCISLPKPLNNAFSDWHLHVESDTSRLL